MSTVRDDETLAILKKPYKERTLEEVQQVLQAPTPPALIEYRGQAVKEYNDELSALALAYVDARFMQNRLDDAMGPFGWQSKVKIEAGMLMVGIGILPPEGEWIWKWDTGQDRPDALSDASGFGGGRGIFSTSFKRACYQWGIGRDLYSLGKPRMRCRAYKKNDKWIFTGWVDHPTGREAESKETGKMHESQVDDKADHMPASSTTFYTVALTRVKMEREQAIATLEKFTDQQSGEINYAGAIKAIEKNLSSADRAFTIQEEELARMAADKH